LNFKGGDKMYDNSINLMCLKCVKNNPKIPSDPLNLVHIPPSPYKLCPKCKARISNYRYFSTHELERLEIDGGVDNKRIEKYRS
jgi:hypothetical protein